jgi:hypothetical protein
VACNDNLVFGRRYDDQLRRLRAALPSFDEGTASHLVAAMLWLDEQFGLRQPDDYVLINPMLAGWLLMEAAPVNPAISRAIEAEDEATLERLTGLQPFEMRFEDDGSIPGNIRGRTVRLRIMSPREAGALSLIYTIRANGEFIHLPGYELRLSGALLLNVQQLQ